MHLKVLVPICFNMFKHEPLNACKNTLLPVGSQAPFKQYGIHQNWDKNKHKVHGDTWLGEKTNHWHWHKFMVIMPQKKSTTYKWISCFRSGEDEPCSGRPTKSVCEENVNAVCDLIEKDRWITTELVGDTLNISVGSTHTILVESLELSKFSTRLLHPDQQQTRADLSMEISNKGDGDSETFLQRIVTGDETWLYQ